MSDSSLRPPARRRARSHLGSLPKFRRGKRGGSGHCATSGDRVDTQVEQISTPAGSPSPRQAPVVRRDTAVASPEEVSYNSSFGDNTSGYQTPVTDGSFGEDESTSLHEGGDYAGCPNCRTSAALESQLLSQRQELRAILSSLDYFGEMLRECVEQQVALEARVDALLAEQALSSVSDPSPGSKLGWLLADAIAHVILLLFSLFAMPGTLIRDYLRPTVHATTSKPPRKSWRLLSSQHEQDVHALKLATARRLSFGAVS